MSMAADLQVLAGIPLFQGLSREQLSRFARLLRRRVAPAGANVITAEQPGGSVYIILAGTVKIHMEQADGTDVILAILGPGSTVGEMSMADNLSRSASVVTLEETVLLWMDRPTYVELLRSAPVAKDNLIAILSRRLRLANAQIQSLAALDVYGRVARQLLAFTAEYGQPQPGGGTLIPIRLTQGDLADLVGASRVRVNQVLGEYRERGYITTASNHYITVHDPDALADRLG